MALSTTGRISHVTSTVIGQYRGAPPFASRIEGCPNLSCWLCPPEDAFGGYSFSQECNKPTDQTHCATEDANMQVPMRAADEGSVDWGPYEGCDRADSHAHSHLQLFISTEISQAWASGKGSKLT